MFSKKTHLFLKMEKSIFSDIGKLINLMKLSEKILKLLIIVTMVNLSNYVNFEIKWTFMP